MVDGYNILDNPSPNRNCCGFENVGELLLSSTTATKKDHWWWMHCTRGFNRFEIRPLEYSDCCCSQLISRSSGISSFLLRETTWVLMARPQCWMNIRGRCRRNGRIKLNNKPRLQGRQSVSVPPKLDSNHTHETVHLPIERHQSDLDTADDDDDDVAPSNHPLPLLLSFRRRRRQQTFPNPIVDSCHLILQYGFTVFHSHVSFFRRSFSSSCFDFALDSHKSTF